MEYLDNKIVRREIYELSGKSGRWLLLLTLFLFAGITAGAFYSWFVSPAFIVSEFENFLAQLILYLILHLSVSQFLFLKFALISHLRNLLLIKFGAFLFYFSSFMTSLVFWSLKIEISGVLKEKVALIILLIQLLFSMILFFRFKATSILRDTIYCESCSSFAKIENKIISYFVPHHNQEFIFKKLSLGELSNLKTMQSIGNVDLVFEKQFIRVNLNKCSCCESFRVFNIDYVILDKRFSIYVERDHELAKLSPNFIMNQEDALLLDSISRRGTPYRFSLFKGFFYSFY